MRETCRIASMPALDKNKSVICFLPTTPSTIVSRRVRQLFRPSQSRKRSKLPFTDHSLKRIVRSNCFKNLVEITRECQDHGITVSRATIHRRLQDMGYRSCIPVNKPLLNSWQKQKPDEE